jgi:mannose-6-phosphate isomerase-like protein (cupin superfamily)
MSVASPAAELTFIDVPARILARGDETGGSFDLVEMLAVPPGHMPPLHVHHAQDEGFYVLEGEVTFHMPGTEVTLGAGDWFLAPRGIPHTYRVGDQQARWLTTSSPAGFERFVADVAALEELDPAVLARVGAEHGIEILGPPGTLP